MSNRIPITVANSDGIGPESWRQLAHPEAAEAPLEFETIDIGEKVYLRQHVRHRTRLVGFVAPHQSVSESANTTPQAKGYKSLNVTVRKVLGLYANVRPCVSYDPFIETKHPGMDVVIVRENEEDLYAGIEHGRRTRSTSA